MSRYIINAILVILFLGSGFSDCESQIADLPENSKKQLNLLILSGRNNHEWQATSPFLKEIFSESGCFSVDITDKPDTLVYDDFSQYDVIVSNWNSWPENDLRWPKKGEDGLLKYLKNGGGLVFFHASSSAFYKWPAFKKISTGAWIDSTNHGRQGMVNVGIDDPKHPITEGMTDFIVFDELWENAEKNPDFKVLGSALNSTSQGKHPAIGVAEIEKGRVFHTILGHHERAIRNAGVTSLLLRGTEWAATGKVSIPLSQELQTADNESSQYSWIESDSTFALWKGDQVIWKYNFNTKHGKPFFHPVYVGNSNITCLSPSDHVWHLGQWFSWKYINHVNYWECNPKTFISDGTTRIKRIELKKGQDFSAEIILDLEYAPRNGSPVLSEDRTIQISPPAKDNSIWMDYDFSFTAMVDEVVLDRTPIEGEPEGQSWGGYAGLSIRFNQDFSNSTFLSAQHDTTNIHGKNSDWLYMGLDDLHGIRLGSVMMMAPETRRQEGAWFTVNTHDIPFYYFSPSHLFYQSFSLKKNEKLNLSYRIKHIRGEVSKDGLEAEYQKYKDQIVRKP